VGILLRVPPLSRKTGCPADGTEVYVFGASPGLVIPTDFMEIQYLSNPSGAADAGMIGHFSKVPLYFLVSIPPKIIAPEAESTLLKSKLKARLLVTPWVARVSMMIG
jgi:hypothetical protein